jgi:spore germination protein YaaH
VVAPEKLVLGLPTYTRVWRERPSSQNANVMTTSSSAIGMEAQNNLIEKYELTPIWDDVDKLYYATFFEEDALVKMWIETPETLAIRAELVNELGLGGIAIWRRGFETQDVWDKLNQVIN